MGLVQSMTAPNFTQKYDKQQEKQYILMTYRSGIVPAHPLTYYTSDSGWGCMLRVAQMFIANLLYLKEHKGEILNIVQLFYDNMMVPFSIQNMTKISKQLYPYMKDYQWYTPCQAGFLVKQMLQKFDTRFQVKICNDGAMFLEQLHWNIVQKQEKIKINNQVKQSNKQDKSLENLLQILNQKSQQKKNMAERLVVLVMVRIGLEGPEPGYLQCLSQIMKNKYFFAIMGGRPKNAHLFMQQRQGYYGYLDPHTTHSTISQISLLKDNLNQYKSRLSWLKQHKIDSSMAIGFCLQKEQLQNFWKSLGQLKQQLANKEDFFIYMDEKRPQIDQNGIIEIGQFQFDDQEVEKENIG